MPRSTTDWAPIRAVYLSGQHTHQDICKTFNIKLSTLRAHIKRHRLTDGQKMHVNRAIRTAVRTAVDDASRTIKECLVDTLKEEQIAWKVREKESAHAVINHVDAWVKRKQGIDPKSLASLTSALDGASRIGRRALGLNDESTDQALSLGSMTINVNTALTPAQEQAIDVSSQVQPVP